MEYAYYRNSLGLLKIGAKGGAICAVRFVCKPDTPSISSGLTEQAAVEIAEYLSGHRTHFSFPIAPEGTPFQRAVWQALLAIPYGETRSYGDIARSIGKPHAARAVGMACNRNPIWIAIPCHRVVSSNGSLTGYAGGLNRKRLLLELERKR